MARPKLGDSDTERMHIKVTAAEMTAIDDWRYSNRIPSRSEAVRRLVQVGLAFDEKRAQEASRLLARVVALIPPTALLGLETVIDSSDETEIEAAIVTDAIGEIYDQLGEVAATTMLAQHVIWAQLRAFAAALKDEKLDDAISGLEEQAVKAHDAASKKGVGK